MAEAFKVNSTITEVNLDDNNIGDTGATALAEALKGNSTFKYLYLGKNNIGDRGAIALAEALKVNSTITNVNLYDNNIGATGARALAEALNVNSTITAISLNDNNIGDTGARALAEALNVNSTITDVSLGNNNIGDIGATALAESLKVNLTIIYIELNNNNIGNEGAIALARALREAHQLQRSGQNQESRTLDLVNNNYTAEGSSALRELEFYTNGLINGSFDEIQEQQQLPEETQQVKQERSKKRKKFSQDRARQLIHNPNSSTFYSNFQIKQITLNENTSSEKNAYYVHFIPIQQQKLSPQEREKLRLAEQQVTFNTRDDAQAYALSTVVNEGDFNINTNYSNLIPRIQDKFGYLSPQQIKKIINKNEYIRPPDESTRQVLIGQQAQKQRKKRKTIQIIQAEKLHLDAILKSLNEENKKAMLREFLKVFNLIYQTNNTYSQEEKKEIQQKKKRIKEIAQDNIQNGRGVFQKINDESVQLYQLYKKETPIDDITGQTIQNLILTTDNHQLMLDKSTLKQVVDKISKKKIQVRVEQNIISKISSSQKKKQVQNAIQKETNQERKRTLNAILRRFEKFERMKNIKRIVALTNQIQKEKKQMQGHPKITNYRILNSRRVPVSSNPGKNTEFYSELAKKQEEISQMEKQLQQLRKKL